MSIAAPPMSAEEFFDFVHRPENRDRRFELEEGEVVEMSRPGERHGTVCGNIAFLLGYYIRQIKRGRVQTNDTGLIIDRDPDTVRGPDVALYLESKKYDELATKYSDLMPTLVVEVLSPNDKVHRSTRRLNRFLDRGVALVWLVDPESRAVTMWWRGQEPIVRDDSEEIAGLPALPDFRCKVAEIFDAPGESASV